LLEKSERKKKGAYTSRTPFIEVLPIPHHRCWACGGGSGASGAVVVVEC